MLVLNQKKSIIRVFFQELNQKLYILCKSDSHSSKIVLYIHVIGYGGGKIKHRFIVPVLVLFTLALFFSVSDVAAAAENQSTVLNQQNSSSSQDVVINESKATPVNPKITFTTSQITSASSRVKTFVDTNDRLPNFVTISNTKVTMPQFLMLLVDDLAAVNVKSTTPVVLKNVDNASDPTEDIEAGSLSKIEYLELAEEIADSIDSTGAAPDYIETSLGKISYGNLIYNYSKIMNYYNTNKKLPNTVSVAASTQTLTLDLTNSNVSEILDAIGKAEAKYGDVQGISDLATFIKKGYGDCWADSLWLYTQLTAAGIQARIMGYVGGGYGIGYRHAWVQINVGNGWQNWNYAKYDSNHCGDCKCGTPYVLIGPGKTNPSIVSTGY